MSRSLLIGGCAALGLVALLAPHHASALDPAARCAAGKLKIAGKYGACRLNAEAKAVKKGDFADYSKCAAKFSDSWQSTEAKAGLGVCPSEGDESTINTRITVEAGELAALLGAGAVGGRFQDCGDGTVADSQTGLMWQKTDDVGGLTDKDNVYTWSDTFDKPDGSAFTTFLHGLNDCASVDGVSVTVGYAGHCDWRLPQIDELQTITDCSFPGSPCIDESVFGPTATSFFHWSASIIANAPVYAWALDFGSGEAVHGNEFDGGHVRAVRAGSCS